MDGGMRMENIDILEEKLREWGASKYSFAFVGQYLSGELKNLDYAISIAVRLSDAIVNQIEDKPTHTYFHHYRSINSLLDSISLRISLLIQEWGHYAVAIPASQTVKTADEPYTGIFQHKTAANLGGLGWIGKSGLLITPEFGPRIRLATVLTDMKLPVNNKIQNEGCGECNKCRSMCPAMAIKGVNWHEGIKRSDIIDAEACSKYMNANFKHIGRGSVCGICMRICPAGKRVIRGI